jgi:hypothetical protein
MFWVCVSFESACIFSLSPSIKLHISLVILCTFSGGELLTYSMFWVCVSVESACISSIYQSIYVKFHSLYYVHSQEVSFCLVPCLSLFLCCKVHVFVLFCYSLT